MARRLHRTTTGSYLLWSGGTSLKWDSWKMSSRPKWRDKSKFVTCNPMMAWSCIYQSLALHSQERVWNCKQSQRERWDFCRTKIHQDKEETKTWYLPLLWMPCAHFRLDSAGNCSAAWTVVMALSPWSLTFNPTIEPGAGRQDTKAPGKLSSPEVPCMPIWQDDEESLENQRNRQKKHMQR